MDDDDDDVDDYYYYYIDDDKTSADCSKYLTNLSSFNSHNDHISWILFTNEKTKTQRG